MSAAVVLSLELPQYSLRPLTEDLQPFRDLYGDLDHIECGGEGNRGGRRQIRNFLSYLK